MPNRALSILGISDQAVAALVGLSVVVTMRLLDWLFPRGYGWKRMIRDWSVPLEDDEEDRPLRNPKTRKEEEEADD